MVIDRARWSCAVLVVVGVTAGCSAPEKGTSTERREVTRTSTQALASSNGLGQNGLSTNGLWTNGLWTNGLWTNGLWTNGLWTNGLWTNGLWTNGLWTNGLWTNGLWTNGLWTNGLWTNGLWTNGLWSNTFWQGGSNAGSAAPCTTGNSGAAQGSPACALQSSGYLRELLQYIYQCAMPAPVCPAGGGQPISNYDATLDPNSPSIACTPSSTPCAVCPADGSVAATMCLSQGTCHDGYVCSATNTCVVPLTGSIGLAINTDGTHWWDPPAAGTEAGTCDESCQRWVSACVLARTNAYGVHVEISMRASTTAPPGVPTGPGSQFAQIGAALATTQAEVGPCPDGGDAGDPSCGYTLREGAYYGNIFETAPTSAAPTSGCGSPGSGCPSPATGPIVDTPTFTACAGPDSNVPAITKRFCSSQGDQVVISVPGVCVTAATQPGVCDGMDNPTTGAIYGCNTCAPVGAACVNSSDCCGQNCSSSGTCAAGTGATGTHYNEVITVYLKQPIAVCGNAVCEPPTENTTNCPSDCHPGTWAKDFSPNIELGIVGQLGPVGAGGFSLENINFVKGGMSAVAPDNTIVVAGTATADIDLGGGTLSASQGAGVLAKYKPDGSYVWGVRFGNTSQSASGGQLQEVDGVIVASNPTSAFFGDITVVGLAFEYMDTADAGETLDGSEDVSADGAGLESGVAGAQYQAIWISTYAPDGTLVGAWSLPIGPTGLAAIGVDEYLQNLGLTRAFAVDSPGNIILTGFYLGTATFGTTSFTSNGYGAMFMAKVSPPWVSPPQGAVVWAQTRGGTESAAVPLSLVVDSTDNIVLLNTVENVESLQKLSSDSTVLWTNQLGNAKELSHYSAAAVDANGDVYATGNFSGNPSAYLGGESFNAIGSPPFIAKYSGVDGSSQWTSYANTVCPPSPLNCNSGYVDGVGIGFEAGNVVLASFGDPAVGGGIDFGFGTFSTYAEPNIFLSAYSTDVGQLVWAEQIPTILSSQLLGIAVDGEGRVVVSGNYSGSMQVDDQLLVTPIPENPVFIDSFLASFAAPSPLDTTPPAIGAGVDPSGTPIFTVPNNIYTQATSSAGTVVFFMPPTAIDNGTTADGGVAPPGTSVVCSPPPNTMFPINTPAVPTTTVTCTASNSLGYQSSATFTVTVVDTTPPVLTVPANVTAEATGLGGVTVAYTPTPTAIDQVYGSITPVCAPASGSTFAVGTTPVTCTASDASGNTATATFTVTVTPACTPTACSARGASCGTISDGCGGVLTCGSCVAPQTCGGGTPPNPNVCGCTPATSCPAGDNCGTVSNGCGGTLSCGSCTAPQTCGGAGVVNQCGCTPITACPAGESCGTIANGCGGTINCGSCSGSQTCGGGGTPNVCGCTPATSCPAGENCGTVSNGCGGILSCGSCTAPQTCGGSGKANECGCTPITACPAGDNCGTVSNGCGGMLSCGSCTAPQTCGGSGKANECGCTPTTCSAQGVTCGTISNGCGGTLNCGTCNTPAIGSFAVYATESIELSEGSSITGCNVGVENTGGPLLAGGAAAYLSTGAKIQSSHTLYASSVYLSTGASLGPIDTNKLMKSTGATYGTVSAFPSMPVPPAAPSAKAGTTAVTVSAGTSKTLASGSYGSVTVSSGATLKLTGGTYVFSSLTLNSGATLAVSAATVLSVTGAASFSGGSSMGPASGSGLTAKSLAVYFDASSGIAISSGAKVRALFVAPKALVTVSTTAFTGAITAAQILMSEGATVACEDGLGSL